MRLLLFAALLIVCFSCNNDPDHPDVSDVPVTLTLQRFETRFFSLDSNNLEQGLHQLNKEYPKFFPFYMQQILQLPSDASGYPVIKQVLNSYAPINDSIQKKYKNLDWLKIDLTNAFKYVKFYYPSYKVPNVITFIGTFDVAGIVLTPYHLGIGLQQYAGKNFSVYKDQQLQEIYPEYISRRFDQEYIVPNSMKAIVDDVYGDSSTGRPLIEQMIEKGKQWYLLDKFLPEYNDTLKTGFTKKQLEWCKSNEGNVWGYFLSNVDLYSIDPAIIQDYIGDAPFTRGMPEGSAPGNIGQWVGWQIVKTYAEKMVDIPLQQLLNTPARTIFQEGKYKPK
jgi:hypothetical protein